MPLAAWAEKNKVQHVRSVVTKLTSTEATLQNGDTISFDVCVVATGADTRAQLLGRGLPTGDGTREARLKDMKDSGEALIKATKVVIVGGGLVGAELAGDVAAYSKQPGKSVTIVHSGPSLCHHEISEKASAMLQRKLENLGVKIILNDKVNEKEDGKIALESSGDILEADQAVFTVGITPTNSFLQESFPGSLNDQGWIDTDDFFRLRGETKMFCIGDCSALLPNAALQYLENVKTIGNNLKLTLDAIRDEKAVDETKLLKFEEASKAAVITVGPKDGVFYSEMCHTQFFIPTVKNKTMFLFNPKGTLGFPK